MSEDLLYLEHIRSCIERLEEYTAGGEEAFLRSQLAQDAVLRNLQVLAQSAQQLSEDARLRQPGIPWGRIRGLRNLLVHQYLDVRMERIWAIVAVDIPQLKAAVEGLLRDISGA